MAEKLQFVYFLHAVDPTKAAGRDNWTKEDHETFRLHWANLEQLKELGVLILAGRSQDSNGTGPAFVILETDTEAEARRYFHADPFVTRGIATATLHSFRVAISRREV